jgi:hypothetical protein
MPGKYNDGNFCTTNENVVAWPKELQFMSMMALSPVTRAIGVDKTFANTILNGARQMLNDGTITQKIGERMLMLGFGPGWPLHFHHSHHSYLPPTGPVHADAQ